MNINLDDDLLEIYFKLYNEETLSQEDIQYALFSILEPYMQHEENTNYITDYLLKKEIERLRELFYNCFKKDKWISVIPIEEYLNIYEHRLRRAIEDGKPLLTNPLYEKMIYPLYDSINPKGLRFKSEMCVLYNDKLIVSIDTIMESVFNINSYKVPNNN